jgi:hypothetical protein
MTEPVSILDHLLDDHRRLHGLLVRAIGTGSGADPVEREAYDAFRSGLLRHIGIEEKLLFPAVRRATGEVPAWQQDLRFDHAALTSLLVPTPDVALLREIESLLGDHDDKEEGADGIYAACAAALAPELLHNLGAQALARPPIRVTPHFDGPGTVRTRAAALEAAHHMRKLKPRDE